MSIWKLPNPPLKNMHFIKKLGKIILKSWDKLCYLGLRRDNYSNFLGWQTISWNRNVSNLEASPKKIFDWVVYRSCYSIEISQAPSRRNFQFTYAMAPPKIKQSFVYYLPTTQATAIQQNLQPISEPAFGQYHKHDTVSSNFCEKHREIYTYKSDFTKITSHFIVRKFESKEI